MKLPSKHKQQLGENINILHVYLQRAIGDETLPNFQSVNSSSQVTTGFPGGSVVKNLPANGWRQEFNPCPRRIPHAAEQLSLSTTTIEPVLWSSGAATTELRCRSY